MNNEFDYKSPLQGRFGGVRGGVFRNFFCILRRFKMATVLNILGLSVAFAAFMLLIMQVRYEWSYDRFHKQVDCIYRLGIYWPDNGNQVVLSRPLIDRFVASSPHIKEGAITQSWISELFFNIEKGGERKSYKESQYQVSPNFTEVFSFDMIEGERQAMENPGTVMIPESMARKFFQDEPALGKQLLGNGWSVTIGGVYKDFPNNSIVRNLIYKGINPLEGKNEWGHQNYHLYLLLDSPAAADQLINNFWETVNIEEFEVINLSSAELHLTQLPDIYYETDVLFDTQSEKGSRTTVLVLFSISLLIILIAGINFTNFSNAMIPMRMKSINIQKVLGSTDKALRRSILTEAMIICFISFGISLLWVNILSHTRLVDMVNADISFVSANIPIFICTAVLSLVTGLLAGIYPSRLITSFSPALVLKGSFGLSPSGRKLRSVLIGFQFISSFVLTAVALFIYMQNRYMVTSLGFETDQIAIVSTSQKARQNMNLLGDRLKSETAIENVSFAQTLLASKDDYMNWGRGFRDKNITFTVLNVSPDFLQFMDIPLKEGRNFREEDTHTPGGVYIFNETARKQYDLQAEEYITGTEWYACEPALIAGFVDDIKFASFRLAINPMAFYVPPVKDFTPVYAYIKIKAGADIREAVHTIKQTFADIDPEYPVEISFYDTVLDNLYKKEKSIGILIMLFSLIAVFISIVGVFGLVLFDSQYRHKEIGIRKIHGATTGLILAMLNNKYIRLLIVCFIFSIPVSYYAISRWLEHFAYKIPLYWWVFALSFLLITCITLITVTHQSWRIANANPVNSLKTE
ncbi:MAG: ABC transporter permease [Tannerellaceae bacterium]|jgi:putative ABC transport system permease protein|nr:ABC transporter permease [Tannerellaceae bacterium]